MLQKAPKTPKRAAGIATVRRGIPSVTSMTVEPSHARVSRSAIDLEGRRSADLDDQEVTRKKHSAFLPFFSMMRPLAGAKQ